MRILVYTFLFCCLFAQCVGQSKTTKLVPLSNGTLLFRSTLTNTAYCSDGSDRAMDGEPRFNGAMEGSGVTYRNYQYVSYYEANGDILIARRKLNPEGAWAKIVLQNYKVKSQDRHNKVAIAISQGDGTIHLAFDHHNTPVLNYARTAHGVADHPDDVVWNDTVFTYTPNLGLKDETGLVTYPSFISLQGTGDLLIYYRTGGAVGGEMNLVHYNSNNQQWKFIGQISSREGHYKGNFGTRGPYHAGFHSDASGVLQVAWLWREHFDLRQDSGAYQYGNHGLYYAMSKDGGFSWLDTFGKPLADTRKGERISTDTKGVQVIDIPMELEASNARTSSAIDDVTGEFHFVSGHYIKGTKTLATHQYIRNAKGEWTSRITNMPTGDCSLMFVNDLLFNFIGIKVYVSTRKKSFSDWKEIVLPVALASGQSNWDAGRIHEGILSLIIQYDPKELGEPTPLEVLDFKIADVL